MKLVYLFLIYIVIEFNINAQSIWSKLNYENSIKIENMNMGISGDIAFALKDKDIVFELTKYGSELSKFEFSDFFYNPNTSLFKDVFYNHQNTLFVRYFFGGGNSLYSVNRTNSKKYLIKDYLVYLDKVRYDKLNTAFSFDYSAITTYTSDWSKEKVIYKPSSSNIYIRDFFPYDINQNYIVLISLTNDVYLYNLNSQTEKATLMWKDKFSLPNKNYVVTESGDFIYGDENGLYKNDGQGFMRIDFDSSLTDANINLVKFDKKGNIIIQSNQDFYWSDDQGLSWTKLNKFHTDLNIIQLEVYDSTYAVALVLEQSINQAVYMINAKNNSWNKVEINSNIRCMTNLIEADNGTLFANDNIDGAGLLFKSYNQGRNWVPVQFEGKEIFSVFNKNGILFGTSRDRGFINYPILSTDNGETWQNVPLPYKELKQYEQFSIVKINDKLLAFFGTETKDTLVVLQSNDDGGHWNYLYNRKRSTEYNVKWKTIDRNDYLYDWTFQQSPVYVSKSYGEHYEIDHRFDPFVRVNQVYFNPDGSAFVNGTMNTSYNNKLFKTSDFVHFDSLDVPFMMYFFFLNVDYYPFVFATSFDKGLWYSRDGGSTWQDYSDGLLLYPATFSLFKDFLILHDSTAITSICFDGLYKTTWKVNSKNLNIDPLSVFYPNPFHDYLQLKNNNNYNYPLQLIIYDTQLKCIQKIQIDNKEDKILLGPTIPTGMLFYQLESNKIIITSGKLLRM